MQSVIAVMEYYTYAFLREDRTPYYIGKGKGKRAYDKKRSFFIPPKERIIFLKKNLTEKQAFEHEKYMIFIFGRKNNGSGILLNKTNGGDGASGSVWTDTQKEKASKERKQRKWWHKGKKVSHSIECPGEGWKRGRPGINVGRTYSQETIEKMKIKATGRKNKTNEEIIEKRKECVWWNDGIKNKFCKECPGPEWKKGRGFYWTNEREETVSIICPGPGWRKGRIPGILKGKLDGLFYWNNGEKIIRSKKCPGQEWKRGKISEGTHWWNNGKKNLKSKECPGKGWKEGLLLKSSNKNKIWWNNGQINKMHIKCPGEGWVRGMIKST